MAHPRNARCPLPSNLWKAARLARQIKRGPGHIAVAHPTKRVTRGRLRVGYNLLKNHRKFTLKQLIAIASERG